LGTIGGTLLVALVFWFSCYHNAHTESGDTWGEATTQAQDADCETASSKAITTTNPASMLPNVVENPMLQNAPISSKLRPSAPRMRLKRHATSEEKIEQHRGNSKEWIRAWSPRHKRPFFVNKNTKMRQWEVPSEFADCAEARYDTASAAAAAAADNEVFAAVREIIDASDLETLSLRKLMDALTQRFPNVDIAQRRGAIKAETARYMDALVLGGGGGGGAN